MSTNNDAIDAMPKAPTGLAAVKPVQAVQCAKCLKLHFMDGSGFLILHGAITRRRGDQGQLHARIQDLGSPTRPTVLCDNDSCLVAFLTYDL